MKRAAATLAMLVTMTLLPAGPASAQRSFVGPAIAYTAPDVSRIIVDDLGSGTTVAHPVRGYPSWSPDGRHIAAIDEFDGHLKVVDVITGEVRVLRNVPDVYGYSPWIDWLNAREIAVPVGRQILAVAVDGSAERPIFNYEYEIVGVDMSPDGNKFVLIDCGEDEFCNATVYNTQSQAFLTGIGEGAAWAWSRDSRFLAFSGIGVHLNIFDTLDLSTRLIHRSAGFHSNVTGLAYHPDGTSVAFGSGYQDGSLKTLPVSGCCPITNLDAGIRGYPRGYSPDGRFLALTVAQTEFTTAVTEIGVGPVGLPGGGGVAGEFAPALPASPPPAAPQPDPEPEPTPEPPSDPAGVTRIAGITRIHTAIAASQDRWADDAAATATIVRADDFADAQAATPLAAAAGGPMLLTYRLSLHPDAAAELERVLAPGSTVYVAGGEAVISEAVVQRIEDLGFEVVRLAGPGRAETAVAVADEVVSLRGAGPQRVFAVQGRSFGEGIVAGNVAIREDGLVAVGQLGIDHARTAWPQAELVIFGDWASDPAAVTLTGADAYELSAEVATRYPSGSGFALASGEEFPDGLAGGTHAGGRALLLTRRDSLPDSVRQVLSGTTDLVVYGGTSAVSTVATNEAMP